MNKAELIESLVEVTGLRKSDVQKTLEAYLQIVSETLQSGENISIRRFGTFTWHDVEKDGETTPEVLFRISPHFHQRCLPAEVELDEDVEQTDTKKVEQELFAELRSLLGMPPSESVWNQLVKCFAKWPAESEGRDLAIEYAQSHFSSDDGWLPFVALEELEPSVHGESQFLYAPTEPSEPTYKPAHNIRSDGYTEQLVKRNETILRAHEINNKIVDLKQLNVTTFLDKVSGFVDVSELSMTGAEIHAKGWRRGVTEKLAEGINAVRSIAKNAKLKQKGLQLEFIHNHYQNNYNRVKSEGSHDIIFDGELLLFSSQSNAQMHFKAEGILRYELSSGGYIRDIGEPKAIVLSMDGDPFLKNFDLEVPYHDDFSFDEDVSYSVDTWSIIERAFHRKLLTVFPDVWEPIEVEQDTEDWLNIPADVRELLTGIVRLFAPEERYTPGY